LFPKSMFIFGIIGGKRMFDFEWKSVVAKVIGVVVGIVFAIVALTAGFWEALIVLACALIGWLIVKFWAGEIDFIEWYENFLRKRGKRD